jgi:multisubunit Na+/H+ antiporter MnhB subunit
MIELYLLLIFILVAAIVAVESHNLLSSVISLGAVGLGLCILFLLLRAPELAITQLVIEVLALIVLIRATIAKTVPETYKGREFLSYSAAVIFILLFIWFSVAAFRSIHAFGAPAVNVSQLYIKQAGSASGVASVVSAIALDFRALDSLGATAAIFAAAIGVIAILRKKGKKEINERDETDS